MRETVLLVGAGVAGLSAAHALLQRGATVTIADGGHAGQSSWAGAGIVCPLLPWDYGEDMNRMALAGMGAWPAFAGGLTEVSGVDPEYWVCGMEVLKPSPSQPPPQVGEEQKTTSPQVGEKQKITSPQVGEKSEIMPHQVREAQNLVFGSLPTGGGGGGKGKGKANCQALPRRNGAGVQASHWTGWGGEGLCGDLNISPFSLKGEGAETNTEAAMLWCQTHNFAAEQLPDNRLWLPKVAQVRNPRLIQSLSGAISSLGGHILHNCKIDGLKSQGRMVTSVLAGAAEYKAGAFVLATGAWAGLPLGQFAPVPNVRPVRGQMLLYAPGTHTLDHILYCDGLYLVPRKDGHLLVGSTLEDAGFDANATPDALARLQDAACALLPTLHKHQPIRSWAGLRPGSPDNLPLVDRHPDFDNLWIHTGHFRYGVTMSPASSRLLVELMFGEKPSLDPAPYRWQAALARDWRC